jgi:hypothetical protein
MRHLAVIFSILLITVGLAATAKAESPAAGALPLPPAPQLPPVLGAAAEDEEGDETESFGAEEADTEEGDAGNEVESCDPEAEECAAEVPADGCPLERASLTVAANSRGRVRLTVRYEVSSPANVKLDYSVRGGKGGAHLGGARAQFQGTDVFHDSILVGARKLAAVLAARQFVVDLDAVDIPGDCGKRLTSGAPHRASRRHRGGAPGRSGAPARTRGS